MSDTKCGSKDAITSSYAVVIWNHASRLAALLPGGGIRYLTWSGRSQTYDALRDGDAVVAYFTPGWMGATHAVEKLARGRPTETGVTDDDGNAEEKEDVVEKNHPQESITEVSGASM